MNGGSIARLVAWAIALTLVVLPIVGVLNGWFASDRWPVTRLNVRAEFDHVSAEQIRAAAQPLLVEGFFAVKLDELRAAVARLPWVERTEVRKRWPDVIDLVVYEQQPYAHWGGDRLVNRRGELFSVTGAGSMQGLPKLGGPDDRLGDVLRFYADCLKEFTGSGLVIDAVTLSPRGGWRLDLASGAVIEIGRDDAVERLKRFLDIWPRLAGSHPGPPAYVDLRYENGFALRWADVAPAPEAGAGNGESGIGNRPKPAPSPTAAPARHADTLRAPRVEMRALLASTDSRMPDPESRPLATDSPFPTSDFRLLP